MLCLFFFFFKQKTAYEMRISDWSSDVCSSDLPFFAKAAVNRVWASFFGRGFVEPVDDFRVSNPAVHEPLLEALADDFANHGYDLKHLMRTILNRSDERRVGKEGVSTCRSRWSPYH